MALLSDVPVSFAASSPSSAFASPVGGVKALAESATDLRQELAGFDALALPESFTVRCASQARGESSRLSQRPLRLRQPEGHLHGAIHLDGGRELAAGLLPPADLFLSEEGLASVIEALSGYF